MSGDEEDKWTQALTCLRHERFFSRHLKGHSEVSLTDKGLPHAEINTLVVNLFAYACDVFRLVSLRIFVESSAFTLVIDLSCRVFIVWVIHEFLKGDDATCHFLPISGNLTVILGTHIHLNFRICSIGREQTSQIGETWPSRLLRC